MDLPLVSIHTYMYVALSIFTHNINITVMFKHDIWLIKLFQVLVQLKLLDLMPKQYWPG